MVSSYTFDMAPIAARSLETILDIAHQIRQGSGIWKNPEPIEVEVARMVKRLFDLLAWSDGQIDPNECALFDRLAAVDERFGRVLGEMIEWNPADPLHEAVPPLIDATTLYDRRTGNRLAVVMVDQFETLGYAIIAANGSPVDIEHTELRTYIDNLRALVTILE